MRFLYALFATYRSSGSSHSFIEKTPIRYADSAGFFFRLIRPNARLTDSARGWT